MNEPSALLQGLSVEAVWRLEEVCCRFEQAWRSGGRPRLEDFVTGPEGDERLALLYHLLRLEVDYRRRAGEGPSAADYQTRFPEATAVLQEVFASTPGPAGPPSSPGPEAENPEQTGPELLPPTMDEGHAGVKGDGQATRSSGDAPSSRYRKLRPVPGPQGNLGEVWVAEDTELHREVVLKEIKQEHAQHQEFRDRFVLEGEVTGRLEHPSIVPVYGLGMYPDGRPYYAMRFIRGENLAEAIAQSHARTPVRFDSLEFRGLLGRFVAVCQAVASAHSRGVLHRDLKPGNIMLGKFGETLVVDWGLTKVTDRPGVAGAVVDEEELLRPLGGGTDGGRGGHAGVHEPGAGAGRSERAGAGDGRVRPGGDPVRAADEPAAVPGGTSRRSWSRCSGGRGCRRGGSTRRCRRRWRRSAARRWHCGWASGTRRRWNWRGTWNTGWRTSRWWRTGSRPGRGCGGGCGSTRGG
jgi:tRNA A-37 threonylcarbamoyl transferase component Bud32